MSETGDQREAIVAMLSGRAVEMSLDELAEALSADLSRRTLQRRVAELIASRRVGSRGRGRATRYFAVGPESRSGDTPATDAALVTDPDLGPGAVSREGLELRQNVRRPLAQRTPVGYRREFLDDYEPNVTAWLSARDRERLHEIGRQGRGETPAGTYARDILGRLLIDLSWASSKLEGNTYTRLDTQNLIEQGELAAGKNQREAQMILNHKAAIEMLVEGADSIGFNRYTVQNLHALLSDNLLMNPSASGSLRSIPVEISGSVFIPAAVPQQLSESFDSLLAKASAIEDPFEAALFVMAQLPYLQPFEDVNKRVSRLAANIPFIRGNLSPLSFVDVPQGPYVDGLLAVYELNRIELLRDVFIWAYERSALRYVAVKDSLPEPDPLRLRHRAALAEVVSDVVRAQAPIDMTDLRQRAALVVPAEDLDQFAAMAFSELHHLHQGNIARYRLRLSEFLRWRPPPASKDH